VAEGDKTGFASERLLSTSTIRAARIALNYIPVWTGAFFVLTFGAMAAGVSGTWGVWLCPAWLAVSFASVTALLRRSSVVSEAGALVVVNPLRRVPIGAAEVVDVTARTFRLGKDRLPLLVMGDGRKVPVVCAGGRRLTIDDWRSLGG
jgi:hypothetical protein